MSAEYVVNAIKIKSYEEFVALKDCWSKLSNSDSEMTVYQKYEWNELLVNEYFNSIYWSIFSSLKIYVLYEGRSPKIILPLLIQHVSTETIWLGRKRGIYILGHRSYSDYLNAIYEKCNCQMLDVLFGAVFADHKGMQCYFTDLIENTMVDKYLQERGIKPIRESVSVAVSKKENCDLYTKSLSKHTRQNLRTAVNRMNSDGLQYELKNYGKIQDKKLLDDLRNIHIARLKVKTRKNTDIIRSVISYIRIAIKTQKELKNNIVYESMQKLEASCLVVMWINGDVAGYLYGLRDGNTIRILQNCFTDKYAFYSPMFRGAYEFILETYDDDLIAEVDFTRGTEEYKYKLGGYEQKLHSFCFGAKDLQSIN